MGEGARVVAGARHDLRAQDVGLLLEVAAVAQQQRAQPELASLGDRRSCRAADNGSAQDAGQAVRGAASAASEAIKAADVPVGGGRVFDALKVVVTQPAQGEYKAFSAVCTHQGCTVAGVEGGRIVCPCHGSQFDISTGAVVQGPATQPLPEKKVTVGADGITVG